MGEGVVIGEDAVMVMEPGNGCRRHWEQKGRAMMGDPWRGVLQGPGAYYNEKTGGIRHTGVAVSEYTGRSYRSCRDGPGKFRSET